MPLNLPKSWFHLLLKNSGDIICFTTEFGVRVKWDEGRKTGWRYYGYQSAFWTLSVRWYQAGYRSIHIYFSGESESERHSVVSDSLRPHGLHSQWNSPGQNPGVGSCSLLQGIFPTQESNLGLLHCRQILYQLNHQGSPHGERIVFSTKDAGTIGYSRANICKDLLPYPTSYTKYFLKRGHRSKCYTLNL